MRTYHGLLVILWLFGIFFPVLVHCAKKNLATLSGEWKLFLLDLVNGWLKSVSNLHIYGFECAEFRATAITKRYDWTWQHDRSHVSADAAVLEQRTHFFISHQGCQIFLDTIYQYGGKIYQIATKLPKGHKMFQMVLIYSEWPKNITNLFHSNALQNLTKVSFLVWKYTIWQPCVTQLFTATKSGWAFLIF
jgi:hypothetical protein